MQKIILFPKSILRKTAKSIEKVDTKLIKEIGELKSYLEHGEGAAGLAAPQLNISKRFFGIKRMGKKKPNIFINPLIKRVYGEKIYPQIVKEENTKVGIKTVSEDFLEGCLSVPNYFGTVKRYLKIEVEWQIIKDSKFNTFIKVLEGLDAIVFQHELDHLDGILFIDRIREEKGKFYKVVKNELKSWDIRFIIKD